MFPRHLKFSQNDAGFAPNRVHIYQVRSLPYLSSLPPITKVVTLFPCLKNKKYSNSVILGSECGKCNLKGVGTNSDGANSFGCKTSCYHRNDSRPIFAGVVTTVSGTLETI